MAAEAAISSAVELLGDLLIEKVKSLQAVEGNVRALKEELEWMQSFLNEANKKQGEDDGVRQWIKKVREVAQDAEDTIEMFTESRRNKGFLSRCTGFAKRMHRLDRIGDEIESIRARLVAIDKSRERYGIRALDVTPPDSNRRSLVELRRQLSPWQKDEHLVGIEADVEKLLRESVLDKEKRGLSVAVIEGMGGIGKSTLAREIYNHSDVVAADRFECRGWVVVSSEFTLKETLKQLILEMPGSDKRKLRELEETTKDELYFQRKLQEMLHEQLRGKKYFIVLDDLWEKEHWECLKSAFPQDQGMYLPCSPDQILHFYVTYFIALVDNKYFKILFMFFKFCMFAPLYDLRNIR